MSTPQPTYGRRLSHHLAGNELAFREEHKLAEHGRLLTSLLSLQSLAQTAFRLSWPRSLFKQIRVRTEERVLLTPRMRLVEVGYMMTGCLCM